jgi:hypothetical protein
MVLLLVRLRQFSHHVLALHVWDWSRSLFAILLTHLLQAPTVFIVHFGPRRQPSNAGSLTIDVMEPAGEADEFDLAAVQ